MEESFHKSGCLICGESIIILEKEASHTCLICNKHFISSTICIQGHYVCDDCHTNTNEFVELLLNSKETNPTILFSQIENLKSVNMHGPEHHSIIPCVLLTAFKNSGGKIDLLSAIETALQRGKQAPGGTCGFWGTCGAAIGAGIYGSIVTESSPLNSMSWYKPQKIVSRTINKIAQENAVRCCKRTSRYAILEAIEWTKEYMGIELEKSDFLCTLSYYNKECIHENCPFYNEQGD